MSGGRLVVLDRLGRDVKAFPLEEGLATIGSDPVCDIRVMLPTVSPHHATVVVHTNQTVVRSVSAGETLVNGAAVSVAALRHGDEVTVGGRTLRWEYNEPKRPRPLAPQPALVRVAGAAGRGGRGARRRTQPAGGAVLVPETRASMPGSSSGKQVAIVQPQRRDTGEQNGAAPARAGSAGSPGGVRGKRSSVARWGSRGSRSSGAGVKIRAPAAVDHTKQAAILLMTRHTPKGKQTPRRPAFVPPRAAPLRSPAPARGSAARGSAARGSAARRSQAASILEITDSDTPRTSTRRSGRSTTFKSPVLSSPKKSSLKDPAKKPNRKTESIKFDLSNLQDGSERSSDVMLVDTTRDRSYNTASEDDLTLHYSDTSARSPSPRKPIHSRSSNILEKSLGATFTRSPATERSVLSGGESPQGRKSSRGSLVVQRALDNARTPSEQSFDTGTSARRTRTPRDLEAYSIVDLVSGDSNASASSTYNSVESSSTKFGTPAARREPPSPRTPVLCIQRLLDESRARPRPRARRRRTLPAAAPARKSLRARRSSPPQEHPPSQDEEAVTPKSAVKLVQEGVKNKHSTAKKPTSKRSIIDDLDDSDLVKQLFNSPVKRKLSRSMTEFSRKQLFEDDEAPLKPHRNTIALTGRTPDNSLLNDTEAFTPEVFVSPLSSPGNSPNVSGVRRLFRRDTPENDLRNVRGVKALLRTPRKRKSVKNDLTNVSGVKKIFEKSPKNRLSDVRVKEVFAAAPADDLRRVWGLGALFRETGRTPRGAPEDVRGVKELFRKSPRNDLRNVSGLKKTLRVNSPRNDLTDVRGVKDLYREQEDRNNLSNLSGVEELFYEPTNLDSTFDLLVGKPRVRSYTKANSFNKVTKPARSARNAKSLHDSIGSITNNVEEWLENELKKRTYNKPTPKKSVSKSNLTRELQKLSTDTVAGNTPVRTSRGRNNTSVAQHQDSGVAGKKSASELYSAHTLPIKKRSLASTDAADVNTLPIKKRRVLHSTPVKGGAAVADDTIGARELGRVSPIQPLAPRRASPDPRRRTKVLEITKVVATLPPSPRRTRGKPVANPSPRAKGTKEVQQTRAKRRRSSLVITKKPPALTPKPSSKVKRVIVEVKKSPSNTKPTRQKRLAQSKEATPKITRSKKVTLVVSKPSPQLLSKSTRNTKKQVEVVEVKEVKKRRSRKNTNNASSDKTEENGEPAPKKGTRKRGRSTQHTPDEEVQKPVKRGRRNVTADETKEAEVGNRGRSTRATAGAQSSVDARKVRESDTKDKENTAPKKRSRRAQNKTEVEESVDIKKTTTRGRGGRNNNVVAEDKKAKVVEVKSVDKVEPRTRRGARTVDTRGKGKENKETKKTTEGNKKTKETVVDVEAKTTRGRKAAVVEEQKVATEKKGRKRIPTNAESPAKVVAVEEKKRRPTRAVTQTGSVQRTASRSRRR